MTITGNKTQYIKPEGTSFIRKMASDILDINALHGGVQTSDLIAAGYTTAQIIEYQPQAVALATKSHVRYQYPSRHNLSDMGFKINSAQTDHPATPDNSALNAKQRIAWQSYCRARAAYALDPWHLLRHRCINRLLAYLLTLPILPVNRTKLINLLDAKLAPAETMQ